jgi:hypothetical protein
MVSRRARRGVQGFLTAAMVSVCRGRDHHGLGGGAVFSGRRSELSAVMHSVWSGARRWARKRAVFSLPARLDELVRVAPVGFGLDEGVQVKGDTMPRRYELCTTRFHPSSAGNAGLALGALGSQATGPERGDRAAPAVVWSGASTGSCSGGASKAIGEVGRPGVLSKLPAHLGAHRSAWSTTGAEGRVWPMGHC